MCVEIPDVRIGEPQVCGGVTVFPLFAERSSSSLDYLLFHEATAAKTLVVSEVSEAGEVPYLLLDNGGDRPVLLVGERRRVAASRTAFSRRPCWYPHRGRHTAKHASRVLGAILAGRITVRDEDHVHALEQSGELRSEAAGI